MTNYLRHLTRLLSFKLMALFVSVAVLLSWFLWVSLDVTFERQFSDTIQPYFSKYLISVQQAVGFPPDINIAKEITDKYPINIVIEAPNFSWSSNGDFIETPYLDVKLQRMGETGLISEAGVYKGNFILRTFNQGYITSFIITEKLNQLPRWSEITLIVVVAVIIIAILYVVTHRLFRPVSEIERGIRRIGAGEVDYRLDIQRHDELGSLADSINKMADNVEQMLETKRQLLLAISHELRTPITRSKIALSLLEDSSGKESALEDMGEMEELIHELLESERLKSNHAPLEISDVNVNEIIYQVQGRFFEHKPLVLNLDSDIPLLALDAGRIGLAVKNLIKNALTAHAKPTDKVIVSTHTTQTQLIIAVSDSGVGIDPAHIPHLTEPFYRIDSSRQRQTGGFGIGLYLIKAIVDAHHGELLIESDLSQGTTVTIGLPLLTTT